MFAVITNKDRSKLLTDTSNGPIPLNSIPESAKKYLQKIGFVKIMMVKTPNPTTTQIETKQIDYFLATNNAKLLTAMGKKYSYIDIKKAKLIFGGGNDDNESVSEPIPDPNWLEPVTSSDWAPPAETISHTSQKSNDHLLIPMIAMIIILLVIMLYSFSAELLALSPPQLLAFY
jgi:hypothetical protein